jgi:hypothetical protein
MAGIHAATSVFGKREELFPRAETLYRLRILVNLERSRINFTPSFLLYNQESNREWFTHLVTSKIKTGCRDDSHIAQASFSARFILCFRQNKTSKMNCSWPKHRCCLAADTGEFCLTPDYFLSRGIYCWDIWIWKSKLRACMRNARLRLKNR